jgi:tetratricopeptide (TPR) repeat protein
MLTKKKKLSRKEIKEDKLISTYYKVYGYFEENRSRLLMYTAILAVVVVAVIYYIENRKEANNTAGLELSRVMSIYDSGSYLEAIEGRQGTNIIGLKKIVEDYGSTENGEIAKIYLANSYNFLGKPDEAVKYYEDYGGNNKIFKATALAGEAGYYTSKNEYEKAADLYRQASLVSEENVLNPEYMLHAGINYLKVGDTEKAKELFDTIKEDYNTSSAFREVERYSAQIE